MKNKKLIYVIAAAVLALAVIIACILLFRRPEQPEPEPVAVETPTSAPSAKPTAAPSHSSTPSASSEPTPTEQPPTITPPAAYSADVTSGSDIQLWPVIPATGSDISPAAASAPPKGA